MSEQIIVKNPATGEVIKKIKKNTVAEINEAIAIGEKAFKTWKEVNANEKSRLLRRWADLIIENIDELAEIITTENGKPLVEAKGELKSGVSYIEWYAEEAKRIYGRTVPANSGDKRILVSKQPIGLVAAITPWNFPGSMMLRKAAPALAAGCTFIVKPAVETPLTTIRLIELAHEAGFEKEVIQYVNGRGSVVGELFTSNKAIKKITFTGSTNVGKILMRDSASTVKSLTMELGGHAPVIVCDDADIDFAVEQTIITKFRNAGQTCVCANRLLVHESILDEFTEKLSKKVSALIIGNGLNQETEIGPVINKDSYEKIMNQIDDAVSKGAEVTTNNQDKHSSDNEAYFVAPTILKNVSLDMNIMYEETFGPVAPITPFKELSEAIEIANDTPYGLASYFFTNDYRTAIYLHDNLDYGIVGWNDGAPTAAQAPFGGVKESGLGSEGGIEGIEPYLETKYLSIGNVE